MLNNVTLMGRLTKDPELRHTQNGKPVCAFTLACERDFGDRVADFFEVVAWNNTAEFVSKYFAKGQLVAVKGRLQARTWEDKHDQKRKETEIIAESVYFAEAKKQQTAEPPKFEEREESEDGELPF